MKFVVTGSAGFVGTNLSKELLRLGHQVVGVDYQESSWRSPVDTIAADLFEGMPAIDRLGKALGGRPDMVIHLAAHPKVHDTVEHPKRALGNAIMTFNVAEFCRLNLLPIIYTSSREVYGRRLDREPYPETAVSLANVCSPYATYKLADEMLLQSYAACYDLKYLIFRLSNVYGRYDSDMERMTRVMHIFIDQISRGEPVTVYDQKKVLDFTWIGDAIEALKLGIDALSTRRAVNQTFNVTSGSPATLKQLAMFIGEAMGKPVKIIEEPLRPGEIDWYVADISKAQDVLGYKPAVPLPTGIRLTIEWLKENEDASARPMVAVSSSTS